MEAQLDKLPLDLCSCPVPRSPAHRVSVPARSHAPHFPAGVGLGCGALFGLLDNRLAVAESVDARQCCAQSFLGDAGLQLGFLFDTAVTNLVSNLCEVLCPFVARLR